MFIWLELTAMLWRALMSSYLRQDISRFHLVLSDGVASFVCCL